MIQLTKSRYVAGLQCPKMLWWTVHEPDAPELRGAAADPRLRAVLTSGHGIGELARANVPGGVLIDLPQHQLRRRVAATAMALARGARAVYEACFLEDGIFVAVDILERRRTSFVLVEVKSTLDVKQEHLTDVAVQVHVLRRAGLRIRRAEVMHLNRECRHPNLSNLFVRENVTPLIRDALLNVPSQSVLMKQALAGPIPSVSTGEHCTTPYECPFLERCQPNLPDHHISTLYKIRSKRAATLADEGFETLHNLPRRLVPEGPARRQVRSVRTGKLIVERGLRRALAVLKPPLAFLDFETVNPAIPVWPGCGPYAQVPVQFSCHVLTTEGLEHHAWLAEGASDPRAEFARALLAACAKAKTIIAYNASFERGCVNALSKAVPALRGDLVALSARIHDLLPIVRDYVYHPDFGGSFSIKSVLPALVPGLGYEDLEIKDGGSASSALEALLLDADAIDASDRAGLRHDLLRYCERDTIAMVRLHERLCELVGR